VLSPPGELTTGALAPVLAHGWGLAVTSFAYRPLGFGSHHWEAVDAAGERWFVTVDDLAVKAYRGLRAALAAAVALRDEGLTFVVAPIPSRDGEPVVRMLDRYAVAVYPFVDGQSFEWGEFPTPALRHAMLERVIAVHTASASGACDEDFAVPHRNELEAALDPDAWAESHGPYAGRAAAALARHAEPVRHLLAQYDALVAQARCRPERSVLTHGEPHPGNGILTPDGLMLVDWDTALVAPPERDLWLLDPGDGSVLRDYERATGVALAPSALALYRLKWTVMDLAIEMARFRTPHLGSADDDKGWEVLRSSLGGLA
jgi:hypothetical protein